MKNMHEVSLGDVAPAIMNQLPEGAFLTVAHGDEVNTMTVGWNLLGRIWNRPICVVPVTSPTRVSSMSSTIAWQPMPAPTAESVSGLVELLCGQPEQKYGVRAAIGR